MPEYIKQIIDTEGEMNDDTVIVEDFNTSLTSMDRSSKQNINKETEASNDMMDLDQMDLIDNLKHFTPKQLNKQYF